MTDWIVRYNFAYRHLHNDSGQAMFKTDPVDSEKIFKIFIDNRQLMREIKRCQRVKIAIRFN